MKITKVSERGIMLTFSPTRKWDLNLYMIKGEKNDFIIDTGCGGDDSEALVSFREKAGGEKPVVVINTHFHFDHVWGNRFFGNCTIIAHKECGRLMRDTKDEVLKEYGGLIGGREIVEPNVVFDGELDLKSERLLLFSSPGHSPDGICIYDYADKVLYAGDNIGDTPAAPVPELMCSKQRYIEALRTMQEKDFSLLLSGHNVPQDKSFIEKILSELK